MSTKHVRMIFPNLPVSDLPKAKEFFAKLGFEYNPKFTDEKAACMIVHDQVAYVMLLQREFFKTFTKKEIADSSKYVEGILAISCGSRAEVDEMADKALAAGATPAMPPQDMGFMYIRTFYDLDGHHWEVMWMDPAAAAPH